MLLILFVTKTDDLLEEKKKRRAKELLENQVFFLSVVGWELKAKRKLADISEIKSPGFRIEVLDVKYCHKRCFYLLLDCWPLV